MAPGVAVPREITKILLVFRIVRCAPGVPGSRGAAPRDVKGHKKLLPCRPRRPLEVNGERGRRVREGGDWAGWARQTMGRGPTSAATFSAQTFGQEARLGGGRHEPGQGHGVVGEAGAGQPLASCMEQCVWSPSLSAPGDQLFPAPKGFLALPAVALKRGFKQELIVEKLLCQVLSVN